MTRPQTASPGQMNLNPAPMTWLQSVTREGITKDLSPMRRTSVRRTSQSGMDPCWTSPPTGESFFGDSPLTP